MEAAKTASYSKILVQFWPRDFFFIFVNKLQADLLPLMTTLPIFNTIYLWSGTHLSVIPCAGAKLRSLAKTFLLSTVILSLLKAGKHHAQLNKYLTTEAALVQPASHGTMIFENEISQRDQVSKYLYLSLTAVEVNPETCICFKRILQVAERESAYNHNAWIRKKKHVLLRHRKKTWSTWLVRRALKKENDRCCQWETTCFDKKWKKAVYRLFWDEEIEGRMF